MKEVEATTHIETMLNCPHCDYYQNRFDDLREYFDSDRPSTDECEAELKCEKCNEDFVVTRVEF